MSSSDKEVVAACYRTLREVASRCTEKQESAAMYVACCAVLRALGKDSPSIGLDDAIVKMLESQTGFVFVPLL